MENYQIESYSGAEMEALFDKINYLGNASQSTDGLMSAADKTKLDGLDSGAQANVLEGVKIAGADLPITEKKVNIPADSSPTSGSNSLVRSGGVFNAIKDFITRSVNDLVYYYTKSETYTKTEVNNIIGSLNQFHYEIYASTSAVTNPKSNVLYLIGPTGTGSDKYEEYVYSNGWVKIGDTTIDLSGYPTTEQMNAAINNALKDYATKEEVSQLGQEADIFFPQVSMRITPNICSNSGYIKSNGDIAQQANYGHSDPIAVQKGQSIVISGVGTGMPYFAYCTQDGTFIRASVVSTGISSVYKITFREDGYVQLNGRVVPTQDGEVVSGLIHDGLTLEDAEYLFKVNVFKYVSSRGTAFTPSANSVKVTLGDVFLYDVISGRLISIADSTERTLNALNRYLVYNGGNIYVRGASSSLIEKGDVVMLYFDETKLDIEGGVLYPSYIKYRLINRIEKTQIKYVSARGAVYNLLASSLEVTLGTLFVYKGSSVVSIPDSTKYTLSDSARFLVVTNSNTIATRQSSAQIQQDDIVLLYYDDNSANKDAVGGLLYPDYIKRKQSEFVSVFNSNVKKYVSARSASYKDGDGDVKVILGTLFVVDSFANPVINIPASNEYTLGSDARFLVLTNENRIATRGNSSAILKGDYILLYYDTADNAIRGGALYADYLASKIASVAPSIIPANLGQLNCIRKAYQMALFEWTPKVANAIPNNSGTFPASKQSGMIYSSAKEYTQFVFEDVSLETFMTAVNNPRSVLYTENINGQSSRSALGRTYHGINCAAYYGSVCSGLLTFAYGLPKNVTTYEFRHWDKMEVIADQTPYGLEIGDAVWQQGHIQLVTGITKDKYGFITDIEIVENAASTTKIKHYSVDALQNYITTYDCVLLRYKELYANRSYTPLTDFVAVMDETKGTYNYNNDLCPNYGDKSNYNEGDVVVLNLRTDYASAGFTTIEVYKGDILLVSKAISGQDETLFGLAHGDYKARIVGASNSEYCYFKVVNAEVTRNGDLFTFSSENATPLYYEFCDIEGRRSYDIVGLSTHTFTDAELQSGSATPTGEIVSGGNYHYLKVHFQTEYGRIIKVIDWNL